MTRVPRAGPAQAQPVRDHRPGRRRRAGAHRRGSGDGRPSPTLKLGVCGEHGGDPESITLFYDAGLDYVSCSPFRVPIARLAAAQAVLGAGERRSLGHGVKPADIGELVDVGDPRVSPDGRTSPSSSRPSTSTPTSTAAASGWWRPTARRRPVPSRRASSATAGPGGRPTAARWPSSRTARSKGSELYVLPVDRRRRGRARSPTWPEEIDELAWSPDGRALAFAARRARRGALRQGEGRRTSRRGASTGSSTGSTAWAGPSTARASCSSVPADGIGQARAAHRAAVRQAAAWRGRPTARRSRSPSARHDTWDLDRAVDLFRVDVPTGGEPARLTATGAEPSAARRGRPTARRSPSSGTTRQLAPTHTPGRRARAATAAASRLLTDRPRPQLRALCSSAAASRCGTATTCFQVEDAGNVHLYRVAADGVGQARAGGRRRPWSPASTSPAARSRSPPPTATDAVRAVRARRRRASGG